MATSYKDAEGVAWCESGNGRRMLFVNGGVVSSEILAIAKSTCQSLAYMMPQIRICMAIVDTWFPTQTKIREASTSQNSSWFCSKSSVRMQPVYKVAPKHVTARQTNKCFIYF